MTSAVALTESTSGQLPAMTAIRSMPHPDIASRAAQFSAEIDTVGFVVDALSKVQDTAVVIKIPSSQNVVAVAGRQDLVAIARVREFGTYQPGWKGPDSAGASTATVNDAERFIRVLFSTELKVAPHIGLVADGEINFFWNAPDLAIDLSILGSGTYSYYAECHGKTYAGDEPIDKALPTEILSRLRLRV